MKKLYVLGHPVAHSKSPAMHNALYRELGLDWHYDLMDCETDEAARTFLHAADFLGINITMPYKPHAFQRADLADSSAVLAQGANVLVWEPAQAGEGAACGSVRDGSLARDKVLKAYNMDGYGCVRYLESEGVDFRDARVVVCGTGPTSLAIMHAAIMAGAAHMTLLGRDGDRTKRVVSQWLDRVAETDDAARAREVDLSGRDYASGAEDMATATLFVDATPLGMKANDPAVVDASLLSPATTVFDVVYGHGETALATSARARGCRFLNGEGMLVGQAVLGAEKFLRAAGVLSPDEKLDFDDAFNVMARGAGFSARVGTV